MKTLQEYLTESSANAAMIDPMVNAYLELIGAANLRGCVDKAIENANKVLNVFNDNNLAEYVTPKMICSIIEKELGKSCDVNGFVFKQGADGHDDKDVECTKIGGKLPEEYASIIGDVNDPHNYGFEVKCTAMTRPSGKVRNNEASFYLVIANLKWGKGTRDANITGYDVYFGYLPEGDKTMVKL